MSETRRWCNDCQAERENWHRHGDPLEQKTWEELLELVRLGSLPFTPVLFTRTGDEGQDALPLTDAEERQASRSTPHDSECAYVKNARLDCDCGVWP